MNFIRIIRLPNLLIIAGVQLLVKYFLINNSGANFVLDNLGMGMLLLATLSIAAGGYIINDIYDVDIDLINKPEKVIVGKRVSERTATIWFVLLNVIGVCSGFFLSYNIGNPSFATIFVLISGLLYLYASYFKSVLLIGNILVSVLVAMSLIIVGLFDIAPAITLENRATQSAAFELIIHYSLFAFCINFVREIIKDIQDINGDKNAGMNSLPILIGRHRATLVTFVLGGITIVGLVYYLYTYLYNSQMAVLYFLFLIIAPLLYFCIKAWAAETTKDYAFLSRLLKFVMLLGIGSIFIYPI